MSEKINLRIFERDTTITPRKLRSIGYIPATIYGKTFNPMSIQVKSHEFELSWFKGIKRFHLEGIGESFDVEVRQVQIQTAKDAVMHIEFCVPSLKEKKIKTKKHKAQSVTPAMKTEITSSEQLLTEEAVMPAH